MNYTAGIRNAGVYRPFPNLAHTRPAICPAILLFRTNKMESRPGYRRLSINDVMGDPFMERLVHSALQEMPKMTPEGRRESLPMLPKEWVSPDQEWFWNGNAWEPVGHDLVVDGIRVNGVLASRDGKWHWTKGQWESTDQVVASAKTWARVIHQSEIYEDSQRDEPPAKQ